MAFGSPSAPARGPRSSARATLLQLIRARPGIHFRALGRAANIPSAGQLRYHLDRLRERGLIIEAQDGKFARFLLVAVHPVRLRPAVVSLSRPAAARIGTVLLQGPMRRVDLRRRLALADSTLSYHVGRMIAAGWVERRAIRGGCEYALTDPDLVREALAVRNVARVPEGAPSMLDAPAFQAPAGSPSAPSNALVSLDGGSPAEA